MALAKSDSVPIKNEDTKLVDCLDDNTVLSDPPYDKHIDYSSVL